MPEGSSRLLCPSLSGLRLRIVATDVDADGLERASRGYARGSLKDLPADLLASVPSFHPGWSV